MYNKSLLSWQQNRAAMIYGIYMLQQYIKIILCIISIFFSIIYSKYGYALDLRLRLPAYYTTHDPGVVPKEISFPLVYYFVGDRYYLNRVLEENEDLHVYPEEVIVPEYLGYCVFNEDFTMRFISKSPWAAPLAESVLKLLADKKIFGGHAGRWVPLQSWHGLLEIERIIFYRGYGGDPKKYITMGIPPDDSFIPIFKKVHSATQQQLLDVLNALPPQDYNDEVILNHPIGAQIRPHAYWSP